MKMNGVQTSMREILFRGKEANSGECVVGIYFPESPEGSATIFSVDDVSVFDLVDPATVGQYTGLKDKNGKRIFEGDVLKYQINIKTAIVGKIVFLCGAFVFESEELEQECDIAFASFADDEVSLSQHCIEIIGNIHDNPELLDK